MHLFKPQEARWFYGCQLFIVLALLAFACYLQWYLGLLPCALCELQRLVFAALGLLFFLAFVFKLGRKGQLVLNSLLGFLALFGILLAARQVWLQYWPPPPGSSSCDASLYYLLQILPLSDVLLNVFIGGPECAKVGWQFLHLSIAQWSLFWFVVFFLLAFFQVLGFARLRKLGSGSSLNKR